MSKSEQRGMYKTEGTVEGNTQHFPIFDSTWIQSTRKKMVKNAQRTAKMAEPMTRATLILSQSSLCRPWLKSKRARRMRRSSSRTEPNSTASICPPMNGRSGASASSRSFTTGRRRRTESSCAGQCNLV
jgi:hypothetical protein